MEKILFLIGLVPLAVFCLVVLIKKKCYRYAIPALGITAVIGTAACMWPAQEETPQVSMEKMNYLIEQSMDEEDYEKAEQYLEQLYRKSGDVPEVAAGQLRLAILQEDMEEAVFVAEAILAASMQKDLKLTKEEEQFIESVFEGGFETAKDYKRNQAMYLSMAENDLVPEEYGFEEISDEKVEEALKYEEKLRKEVRNAIEENVEHFEDQRKTESFIEACRIADKLATAMDENVQTESESSEKDAKKIKKYIEQLTELNAEDEEILAISEFNDLYINACTQTEEYEALIQYAARSKDKDALTSVAYLCMAEEIKERNLQKAFPAVDYNAVMEACEDIYEKLEDENDKEDMPELVLYEKYLEALDARKDNKALAAVEYEIAQKLEQNGGNAGDYFQNAAINSELQDKEKVFENLDKAIDNKESCDDEALSDILDKLGGIRDKTADDDEVIRFNEYLMEGYKESLPIKTETVVVPESFLNTGNVYMNENRSQINIGLIDTENMPMVQAYISVTDIDLKDVEDLVVSDCGIMIEDYRIEKVRYDSAQIMLVCDNSGSMSGDVNVLQEAVRKFIETRKQGEEIGIVTFDSDVMQKVALTKKEEVLLQAVDQFTAAGGTNIKCGVDTAMMQYNIEKDSFKVMIVMTDGQDSSYWDYEFAELRNTCKEKDLILYTIGLGDVSADYLERLADSGMGSFVYCNNSTQLEELYTFIHNQMDNNYVLTYRAADTNTMENRVLLVSSEQEGFTASRTYSLDVLPGQENDGTAGATPENITGVPEEETTKEETKNKPYVRTLGISNIVKSTGEIVFVQYFSVLGSNFDEAEKISISLKGQRQYVGLGYTVEDSGKLLVELPKNVEADVYEVLVNIDGTTYTLRYLTVSKPSAKTELRFGDYEFRADTIKESYGTYILSGNVVMNDYLHFKGEIQLTGSLNGYTLVLTDKYGSYIEGTGKLPGILADYFDNKVSVPRLDGLTLYSEAERYDKFYTRGASLYGPLEIRNPNIELHSDYLKYYISEINLDFPILDKVLEYAESPITVKEFENSVILSKDRMGFTLNVESNVSFDKSVSLGKAKLELDSVKLALDTFQHNYNVGLAVKMKGVPVFGDSETTYGLEIGIASGRFDSIDLGADIDINVVTVPVAGVPLNVVTLADFHAGIKDVASMPQGSGFAKSVLGATLYGQTDVNFFKLNQVIPGLDVLLGDLLDISVLKLEDTTLGVRLNNWKVTLEASAVLFEMAELGKVEAALGHYDYSNYVLGISQETTGIYLQSSQEYDLRFGNWFEVGTTGTSRVDVSGAYAGLMFSGNIHYNIDAFGTHIGDMNGIGLIGLHENASQFTILLKGTDYIKGNAVGFRISFTEGNLLPEAEWY